MFKELFSPSDIINLNSGTLSKTPLSVIEAMQSAQRAYEINPTRSLFESYPKLWSVQQQMAAFLGAKGEDLFFRANVTAAFNTFFFSYPWPKSGEILVGKNEYPAMVNIAKVAATANGLSVRAIDTPTGDFSEADCVDAIIKQFTPQTRGLLLSHVCTSDGLVLPIQKIATQTRQRGIIFAVDGAHAAGALPLNFSDLEDVDFYGSNLHKWMMAPKGTGFGWMPKRIREQLVFNHGGWASFNIPALYGNFANGDQRAANLVQTGCFDMAPFFALEELLNFWQNHGIETIRQRIFALQSLVEKEVDQKLGWQKVSPPFGSKRGPLLAYLLPEGPWATRGESLIAGLSKDIGVQVHVPLWQGKPVMRFTPHIYLEDNEIVSAITKIKAYRP